MCCGQKRAALKSLASGLRENEPVDQSGELEQTTASPRIDLLYLRGSPIHVRGMATGILYQFSGSRPIQSVDQRDAAVFLRTRLFRQAR